MKIRYRGPDVLRGILIYSIGDTVASLILSQFSVTRLLGMMAVGGGIYAVEIPAYFRWIDKRCGGMRGIRGSMARTGLALLYFNPLWIARHLLFIQLFSLNTADIGPGLLRTGLLSFSANIPVAVTANYLIQNRIPLKWRFFSSAVFSSMMAIYYALSSSIF